MIEFVRRKIFVSDALLFLLLLIVPDQQKKLTTTADPMNLTQCVLQNNDSGLNFGCSGIADSMIWVRLGYYGLASSNKFCNDSSPSASDCIPDPRGDRRNIASQCNRYSTCQVYGKTYSDIIALCPANNGGFPYARVSYECLSRKQADGNYINTISSYDQSSVYSDYYGKVYIMTNLYPYSLINNNVRFRVTVERNTKVSIRLLDAYGHLLNATGSCAFTLYIYSALTSTYREWCVNSTSWTVDDSIPVVFPASLQGSQDIDIVFTKTNPNLNAEGAFWMLIDAVNVVDNSPGRGITVYSGSSFTPQVQPTTITQTSTTTTTPTTTTPTTTTPTTTTPTTTTPTTTTPTTTTPTTTTPTTTTPTTTTPTTTTPTTTTPTTTTATTTTPTTTTPMTTSTTTPTTTTPTTTTTTTPTSTMTITTPTTTTSTTMTPRSTPTMTTTTLSPAPTAPTTIATTSTITSTTSTTTTTPMPSLAPATLSTVTSGTQATESVVSMPSTTSSPTMNTSAGGANNVNGTNAAMASQNTSLIIGVVVAAAGVIIIIIIVVVVAVICRRNLDRKSKPRGSVLGLIGVDRPIIASYSSDTDNASKGSSRLHGREHIYDEIHEPSVAVTTHSYPPQQHHPASPTILRNGGQSRKIDGAKVRFTTPGGDEDMVFYPGVASNVSDDDKVNRQTAQNADEVHPRKMNVFTPSKRISFVSRQGSVPSSVGDPAIEADTGVIFNPLYGFRPQDIYMY